MTDMCPYYRLTEHWEATVLLPTIPALQWYHPFRSIVQQQIPRHLASEKQPLIHLVLFVIIVIDIVISIIVKIVRVVCMSVRMQHACFLV